MSCIVQALHRHARTRSDSVALEDEAGSLTFAELDAAVERASCALLDAAPKVMGLLADNGRAWVIADLAAQKAGVRVVPLPLFMSTTQMAHAIRTAGIDCVLTDAPDRIHAVVPTRSLRAEPFCEGLSAIRIAPGPVSATISTHVHKITFTSGTTGEPKGVCLDIDSLANTAIALCVASAANDRDRHLCVLPLATLLENIGGIYAPILAGATICVPRLAAVGLTGSSGFDVATLLAALSRWRATSAILVPQMAQAIVAACRAGAPVPTTLRHVAVGGAPVPTSVLTQARALRLPLSEGYGLSECASVVALNRPGANRIGSVGQPLPHVRIEFAADGEILIGGVRWFGYLGDESALNEDGSSIATGDLGYLDADGYLYLTGRKKNMFVTSFGRNVAPEWVERELMAQPSIAQAAIFGEARPFNTAVIVPRANATDSCIDRAVETANEDLPDYARVRAWIRASEPFSAANAMATPNGRFRRSTIRSTYGAQIDAHYEGHNQMGAA